ncbi:hypothetical protein J6590_066975 [Homalodisca vitripennis]|nr:hypothetical protein J6590_066975 [Homalodisca vitripennis]
MREQQWRLGHAPCTPSHNHHRLWINERAAMAARPCPCPHPPPPTPPLAGGAPQSPLFLFAWLDRPIKTQA